MKYLLLIHLNHEGIDSVIAPNIDKVMEAHNAVARELTESGELVETNELRPTGSRIVRTQDGEALVTDGPFTEGREWVAGYYIVDCVSVDRATEIAARLVEASVAPVEVRPIHGS